jgi:CheY-like chemotaxis protein
MSGLELEGYQTGIIVAPVLIQPSRWMGRLWDEEPVFDDATQIQSALGAVGIMFNTLSNRIERSLRRLEAERICDYRPDFQPAHGKPSHEAVRNGCEASGRRWRWHRRNGRRLVPTSECCRSWCHWSNDADNGSRTVLVVEDDELLRATVSEVLRSSRFDVREAATVGDATRLLASMPAIDILFSDIRLPDGSGFKLAKWCREVRPHLRIILTSGWYKRPTAAGEFLVLLKPYSFGTLLALLKQLSPRRSARLRPIEVKYQRRLTGH